MVVFACNSCGESMKKAQVEKHSYKCRQCNVLSCVDCGKEFWGNDYQQHTKCITEDEKYGGKNYKPKPGANKGEIKQELWIQQVQDAINNTKGNPKLLGLLEKLKDYPNIPRKKVKFENFVKNSLRVREQWLIDQVWEAMASNIQKPPTNSTPNSAPQKNGENGKAESLPSVESTDATSQEETERKKSKREKKEERSKKQSKKQKKTKTEQDTEEPQPKKSKKRKRDDSVDEDEEIVQREVTKKKKKKKHCDEEDEVQEALNTSQTSVTSPVKQKFNWEQCILQVLRKNENELKIKKLRKKVLNEYLSCCGDQNRKSDEQLWSLFEKKVKHTYGLKIQKERVKLIES
ncbi:cell growth-regulating nucleolar protein-like [Lineus longissimus]|uniref:cell growth-regulating nucleolar protein-like n=1 Tax=Lineus longissimus TaxID=88925 RepID=UPI002B4CE6B3